MSPLSPKQKLFELLLQKQLSEKDLNVLLEWLGSDELDEEAAELIINRLKENVGEEKISPEIKASLEARLPFIFERSKERKAIFRIGWMKYAAAVIVVLAVGFFLLQDKKSSLPVNETIAKVPAKILPGKEGGILTLADGKSIVLDSLGNGSIATQEGNNVILSNGELFYKEEKIGAEYIGYHTMTTPRGREFKLILPDGTRVWLNAASSLRYPSQFTGKERRVILSGEAYFEVAKNKEMPFRVVCDKQIIEVLGTEFNVNSYSDEPVTTTTIKEGSVKVIQNGSNNSKILKPGQKTIINNSTGDAIQVVSADVISETAWTTGVFMFESESLKTIMAKISRWYNVEIEYNNKVSDEKYSGVISRFEDVSKILKMLELTNTVKFRIEGAKIIVI